MERFGREYKLDLNPDFQRGHVWNDEQRAAFIEFALSGGPVDRVIRFACEGWQTDVIGPMVIVDGKQRLESVRRFMSDRLRVRGKLFSEWTGRLRFHHASFRIEVADTNRVNTLRWYLAINAGGTPHTDNEIERVRRLLATEQGAR